VLDRYWAAYQEKHGTTTWRKRTAVAKVFTPKATSTTSTEPTTAEPTTKVNNSGRLVVAELARPMAKCDSLNLSPAFRDRLQADLAKMGQAAVGRYVGTDSN
jgi:hypothetical protein